MLGIAGLALHPAYDVVYAAGMPEHAADKPTTRRVQVEEAAKILGITANAVRKRIERGTLRSERDGDTRYVLLGDDVSRHAGDTPNGMPTDQALMVARLESEVEFLRELVRSRDEELRREREAREEAERRHDTIVMRMAERIPELPPAAPQEPRDGRVTAGETPEGVEGRDGGGGPQEGTQRRSWWRRLFG